MKRSQLELVQLLVNLYLSHRDRAYNTATMLTFAAAMVGMDAAAQTEYLLAWLRDRGVAVDVSTRTVRIETAAA